MEAKDWQGAQKFFDEIFDIHQSFSKRFNKWMNNHFWPLWAWERIYETTCQQVNGFFVSEDLYTRHEMTGGIYPD